MTTDGTIPARDAQIHWSTLERHLPGQVNGVLVFNSRSAWEDDERLECSAGACCSDWLDGSDPRSTPEGIYTGWLQHGFADEDAHIAALEELAKIEGCAWARTMADARRRSLPSYGEGE